MINKINPFDMPDFGIRKAESTGSPEKIGQNFEQKDAQNAQGIDALQKTDENSMIDTSSITDDTEGFNTSNFKNNEELTTNIEEIASGFFNKKNPQE